MPLSDRDRAIFEDLAEQLETDRARRPRLDDGKRRGVVLVATAVVGIAALPAALATNLHWIGLVGFLAAVPATARLLAQVPRPNREWLRENGLLPRAAHVDRRCYDGTVVNRRTFILPGRLIAILIVVIVLPLVVATAITQPERTLPASDPERPPSTERASLPVVESSTRI